MSVAELHPPSLPAPIEELSQAEKIALLRPEDREAFYASLSEQEAANLAYEWEFWARPDQLPPPEPWSIWVISGGRGIGKSRSSSEWVRQKARTPSVGVLVGANPRDVRDIMIEGQSGIRSVSPPWERPYYEPSKMLLSWPNGSIAHVRSAAEPEGLRGLSVAWAAAGELGKWARLEDAWDNLRFAIREGDNVQTLVDTTPRPVQVLRDLLAHRYPRTVVARRTSSYRNAANLSGEWFDELVARYEDSPLGRQEIHGELLDEVEGALWTPARLDATRVNRAPDLFRIVVGVDPPGESWGAECGIIVCGLSWDAPVREGGKAVRFEPDGQQHLYVLADASLRGDSDVWASQVVATYHAWSADAVAAEVNHGGDMVRGVIALTDSSVNVHKVRTRRGKHQRAEPVAVLWGPTHPRGHMVGHLPELESQLTTWTPGDDSPDRLDALVGASAELMPELELAGESRSYSTQIAAERL